MNRLEKAYLTLQPLEVRNGIGTPNVGAGTTIVVSVVYLAAMLSVPMGRFSMLIWFALYPIIASAWVGIRLQEDSCEITLHCASCGTDRDIQSSL